MRHQSIEITCPGTLVAHADGEVECDRWDHCLGDAAVHDWEIACDELGCGCAGDEDTTPLVLAAAA